METESDENLSLDRALDKLDMLSTITDARRAYLDEMRLRGIRPGTTNIDSSWKYQRSEPSNINGSPSSFVTKDSYRQRSHSSSGLQNGNSELTASTSNGGSSSNSHLNKLQLTRHRSHHHSRISPYGYSSISRRRPLNTLSFGSSSTSSSSTSSVGSTNTEDNNSLMISSTLTSFTHFLKEHQKLQQKYLEQQQKSHDSMLASSSSSTYNFHPPINGLLQLNTLTTYSNCDGNKKIRNASIAAANSSMTEDFSIPNLTRSKSLEDLRECIKPKPKSMSSYFCGDSSLDASSLSPRSNYCDLSAFQQTFQSQNVEEERLIKSEIDSMSMRIGNLDVG